MTINNNNTEYLHLGILYARRCRVRSDPEAKALQVCGVRSGHQDHTHSWITRQNKLQHTK